MARREGTDGISEFLGFRWDASDTLRVTVEEKHINAGGLLSGAVTDGHVVCTTRLDRRNRRLAVMQSEVHAEDGRLLATAIGSYTIFPRRG